MQEEIIIDGVDIAGCRYYHYKGCTANNFCKCDSNLNICKNCYYKQLKRLEQENKELKKQIESQKGLITVGSKQQYDMTMTYDKCKSVLEKIKSIVDKFDYWNNNLPEASEIIGEVKDKINEVLQ